MSDDLKARLHKDAALARRTLDFPPIYGMNAVMGNRLLRFERSLKEAADHIEKLERERDAYKDRRRLRADHPDSGGKDG